MEPLFYILVGIGLFVIVSGIVQIVECKKRMANFIKFNTNENEIIKRSSDK